MKYYSETLNKLFDTEQELLESEHKSKLKEDLKSRVNETYDTYLKAQENANKVMREAENLAKPLYEQIDKIYEEAEKRSDEIIAGPKRDWIKAKEAYYAQKSKEPLDVLNVHKSLFLLFLYLRRLHLRQARLVVTRAIALAARRALRAAAFVRGGVAADILAVCFL